MSPFAKVETLDLDILKYNAATVLDRLLLTESHRSLEIFQREVPEQMAYQIAATLRVPGKVLQDRKVIATYPETLWDYIKRELKQRFPRLKLVVKMKEVRLTEHLVYPEVSVPDRYSSSVRLYIQPEVGSFLR
jgi:hypothetical protein